MTYTKLDPFTNKMVTILRVRPFMEDGYEFERVLSARTYRNNPDDIEKLINEVEEPYKSQILCAWNVGE